MGLKSGRWQIFRVKSVGITKNARVLLNHLTVGRETESRNAHVERESPQKFNAQKDSQSALVNLG